MFSEGIERATGHEIGSATFHETQCRAKQRAYLGSPYQDQWRHMEDHQHTLLHLFYLKHVNSYPEKESQKYTNLR